MHSLYTIASKMVQILCICDDHWAVISNLQSSGNELKFYDTVHNDIDKDTIAVLHEMKLPLQWTVDQEV